ncbi:MAG TPA: hypothetical protein VFR02_03485 [bacterium]|nr:hypothetical protein [bacterium]
MEPTAKILEEVLPMLGAFRVEKGRWPLHAAELQAFAFSVRKPLDLSWFHRLAFRPAGAERLAVDFTALPAEDFWAERGRVEVSFTLDDQEPQTLPLKARFTPLGAEKVELRSFCPL